MNNKNGSFSVPPSETCNGCDFLRFGEKRCALTTQEKMARAKALTYERLKTALEDFEQVNEYSFASLENIEGEDWWTVVSIVAKKNYDIDEALEEFEIKKETKRKRQEEKEKKEKKKTSKSQSFFYIFFQKKIRKFLEKI